MSDVHTVLFDFGGVVIRTPFELHDSAWRGPFDRANDALWRQSETGEITEREYWHQRAAELHPDADDPTYAFMRELYEHPEERIVRPEIVALLDELDERGIRTAALTNDLSKFHPPEWIARMTVIRRFDPLLDLSHAPALKPSPAAFAYALDQLAAPADTIVLLDDQHPNVNGALASGLRAVWFDPTDVRGSIERLQTDLDQARERAFPAK